MRISKERKCIGCGSGTHGFNDVHTSGMAHEYFLFYFSWFYFEKAKEHGGKDKDLTFKVSWYPILSSINMNAVNAKSWAGHILVVQASTKNQYLIIPDQIYS